MIRNMNNVWDKLPANFTVLAPMEGVTDVVFRQVIARAGRPDVFFTEFTNVSSFASEEGRENALERLEVATGESPIIAQIWGKNPEHFAKLASALQELGFDGLDLNMGCPDRHVNRTGGGAAMIQTPDLAIECIRQAKQATQLPVSVKTRLGYTRVEEFQEWIPLLLREGLVALTVHLRTRKEMSKVPAHYELIPKLVELRDQNAPQTKLIINGDIKDVKMSRALASQYAGVDGWMIGRGVFENPYCFTDHQPTKAELLDLLNLHLDLFNQQDQKLKAQRVAKTNFSWKDLDKHGNIRGLPYEPLKHYFKIYIHGFEGASELRARLMEAKNTTEVRRVLAQWQQITEAS